MLGSAIVSVGSLWLSSWEPMLDWLRVPANLRDSLGTSLSILVLFLGFLPVLYLQSNRLLEDVDVRVNSIVAELRGSIPHFSTVEVMSADTAFLRLAESLPHARHVWNTRIANPTAASLYVTRNYAQYLAAMDEAVRNGLIVRDVVVPALQSVAARLGTVAATSSGTYECRVVTFAELTYVNFIALDFQDGRREVYFGWAISRARGFEQPCFRFRDERIVEFFVTLHGELFAAGDPLDRTGVESAL